jgi:hypothetical protein
MRSAASRVEGESARENMVLPVERALIPTRAREKQVLAVHEATAAFSFDLCLFKSRPFFCTALYLSLYLSMLLSRWREKSSMLRLISSCELLLAVLLGYFTNVMVLAHKHRSSASNDVLYRFVFR